MPLAIPYFVAWLTLALSTEQAAAPEAKPRRKLRAGRNRHLRGTVRLDAGQPLLPQLASLR